MDSNQNNQKYNKIVNLLLNEKGIYNSDSNNIEGNLYHYTDINGLYGILDTEIFRATQSEYLNDSTEIVYIEEVLEEVLQRLKKDKSNEACRDYESRINSIKDSIRAHLGEKVFILSFSEKEDTAHLFRSYAKNDGYCLGFNGKNLLNSIENLKKDYIVAVWNGPVIYDKEKQVQNIIDVSIYLNYIMKKGEINVNEGKLIIDVIIIIASLFYKNVAFEDEREYRIVLLLSSNLKGLNYIKHRVSNNLIIPYVDAKFDIDSLKEILIGPTNRVDIIEKSLKSFLDIKKFKKDFNDSEEEIKKVDSDIEIKKSGISLRY